MPLGTTTSPGFTGSSWLAAQLGATWGPVPAGRVDRFQFAPGSADAPAMTLRIALACAGSALQRPAQPRRPDGADTVQTVGREGIVTHSFAGHARPSQVRHTGVAWRCRS